MKKLLVAILALGSVSAFAGGLVELTHDGSNSNFSNFRFNKTSDDVDGSEKDNLNMAFNYTHNINDAMMAGLSYASDSNKTDGNADAKSMTELGVHFFYNLSGKVMGSYVGLRYLMGNYSNDGSTDGDTSTTIALEYGHRFALGKLAGVNWAWAPKFNYNMNTYVTDASGDDDVKTTVIAWTPVNFNVVF